jgi:hypothetical protein
VRREAIVIELDAETIRVLDMAQAAALRHQIGGLLSTAGIRHPVSFQTYRMGSAFLRPSNEQ